MSRRKTLQSRFEFKIGVLQYPVGGNRNRDIAVSHLAFPRQPYYSDCHNHRSSTLSNRGNEKIFDLVIFSLVLIRHIG